MVPVMQFAVGITALLALIIFVQVLPLSGYLDEQLRNYSSRARVTTAASAPSTRSRSGRR
jgi:hypothetical protein